MQPLFIEYDQDPFFPGTSEFAFWTIDHEPPGDDIAAGQNFDTPFWRADVADHAKGDVIEYLEAGGSYPCCACGDLLSEIAQAEAEYHEDQIAEREPDYEVDDYWFEHDHAGDEVRWEAPY